MQTTVGITDPVKAYEIAETLDMKYNKYGRHHAVIIIDTLCYIVGETYALYNADRYLIIYRRYEFNPCGL